MKEYKILESFNMNQLQIDVNNYLKNNWDLCGGVFVSKSINHNGDTCTMFYQSIWRLIPIQPKEDN